MEQEDDLQTKQRDGIQDKPPQPSDAKVTAQEDSKQEMKPDASIQAEENTDVNAVATEKLVESEVINEAIKENGIELSTTDFINAAKNLVKPEDAEKWIQDLSQSKDAWELSAAEKNLFGQKCLDFKDELKTLCLLHKSFTSMLSNKKSYDQQIRVLLDKRPRDLRKDMQQAYKSVYGDNFVDIAEEIFKDKWAEK